MKINYQVIAEAIADYVVGTGMSTADGLREYNEETGLNISEEILDHDEFYKYYEIDRCSGCSIWYEQGELTVEDTLCYSCEEAALEYEEEE